MAIDFPNSPTNGQTYTVGSFTWQYDGEKWVAANGINLDGLTDVTITTPEEFQSLTYDGSGWVNSYAPVVSYVRNAESNTLTTGTVVYIFSGTGDHASVKRADNDSDATSAKTIGVVAANIAASQNGPVVTRGYVDGIDLSAYTNGDTLYLGEDGGYTVTKPKAPEHLVYVGVVVRNTNNGIMYVQAQNGYELDEIHDVNISNTLASGEFLKYNGTVWVNDVIDLGTDTNGNYMSNVTAGQLISITHTPGEGSNATIALANGTAGQIIVANATGVPVWVQESGDVTIDSAGVAAISSNVIVNADINSAAAIALSKLASGSSAQIILGNATGVPTYTTVSGDVTITNTGNVQIAANAIANADISTTAQIIHSKLANTSSNAQILMSNASNVITATSIIGDVTLAANGNVQIAANAIGTAEIADSAVTAAKIEGNVSQDDQFVLSVQAFS